VPEAFNCSNEFDMRDMGISVKWCCVIVEGGVRWRNEQIFRGWMVEEKQDLRFLI